MAGTIEHDGRAALRIRFRYDPATVDLVKSLPRRRWRAPDRYWEVPQEDLVQAVDLLTPAGFTCDEDVRTLYAALGGAGTPAPSTEAPAAAAPDPPLLGLFDGPAPGAAATPPGGAAAPLSANGRPDEDGEPGWTVSRLNRAVSDLLAGAFPAPLWIVGEISGWNKRRPGRRFHNFELVERDDRGNEAAKISAMLWEDDLLHLERKLAEAGDPFHLEDELTVRLRGRVELFERWGLYRVRIQDIDVHWTLGEAARRREEIVRRLIAEGLTGRNPALPLPDVPLRVGLVTSIGSDAYNDVLRTLQESGFAFRVTVHGARVQGPSTEPSVLNALDWLRAQAVDHDVVLICRGGGARTDLAWFDSERLGRAVATFPLPVVVGIGHEQDVSVLDHVARTAKTPTAAAGLLVERVREFRDRIEAGGSDILLRAGNRVVEAAREARDRARRLARAARHRIEASARESAERRGRAVRGSRHVLRDAARVLDRASRGIPRAAGVRISVAASELESLAGGLGRGALRRTAEAGSRVANAADRLGPAARRALAREDERRDARERRLHLVHPRRVLERGYAILRGSDGVVVSVDQAPAGSGLTAELRDGRLRLRSEGGDGTDGTENPR